METKSKSHEKKMSNFIYVSFELLKILNYINDFF